MRCKSAERWILRSLDGAPEPRLAARLEAHLEACPGCRRLAREYRAMTALLRADRAAEPLPRFWERLAPKIAEEARLAPLITWERWSLRAIPVFLALVAVVAGLVALTPPAPALTTSEALLLRDDDPLTQALSADRARSGEDQALALLFASSDGRRP